MKSREGDEENAELLEKEEDGIRKTGEMQLQYK